MARSWIIHLQGASLPAGGFTRASFGWFLFASRRSRSSSTRERRRHRLRKQLVDQSAGSRPRGAMGGSIAVAGNGRTARRALAECRRQATWLHRMRILFPDEVLDQLARAEVPGVRRIDGAGRLPPAPCRCPVRFREADHVDGVRFHAIRSVASRARVTLTGCLSIAIVAPSVRIHLRCRTLI